jgi:hypothetical protein
MPVIGLAARLSRVYLVLIGVLMGLGEYLTDLTVAKPELAPDMASATSTECPMMGFDVGYQLDVESKAMVAVVVAF